MERMIILPGAAWRRFMDVADDREYPELKAALRTAEPRRKGRGFSYAVNLTPELATGLREFMVDVIETESGIAGMGDVNHGAKRAAETTIARIDG